LAVYLGHGSVGVLRGLLDLDDVPGLANGPRLPTVALFDCLSGFFHDVFSESLAEELVRNPAGGAAAVWAPAGLTSPAAQGAMARAFVGAIARGEAATLGDAV